MIGFKFDKRFFEIYASTSAGSEIYFLSASFLQLDNRGELNADIFTPVQLY